MAVYSKARNSGMVPRDWPATFELDPDPDSAAIVIERILAGWRALAGKAPLAPAVYALLDHDARLIHVGYSGRLRERLAAHPAIRQRLVARVKYRECDSAQDACLREGRLILRLVPLLAGAGLRGTLDARKA